MESRIALPSHSLANLVQAAYVDGDAQPGVVIRHLLEPYHITAEQVEALAQTLYWPPGGLGRRRMRPAHPLWAVVKEVETLSSHTQRKCLDAVNKARFIMVATSISHVWCSPSGLRRICTYQGVGAPIPHAWLHIDHEHGLIALCSVSPTMPALVMNVQRHCSLGYMQPLDLDLNVERGTPHGCAYVGVHVGLGGSHEGATTFVEVDLCPPSVEAQDNFALIFTAGGCALVGTFLCSPSLQRTWSLPIMVHNLPPEGGEEEGKEETSNI